MVYFFAILYTIDVFINLFGCITGNQMITAASKPFLMPLLMASAVLILIQQTRNDRLLMICIACALAFGTLGDVFLLSKEKICFVAGLLSFLVGHIFWISINASKLRQMPQHIMIICAVLYAAYIIAAFNMAGKPAGILRIGIILYLLALCILNLTGVAAVWTFKNSASVLFFVGTILFPLSDTLLGYSLFCRKFPLSGFFIMLTYIAAQTLLTAGSILPVLAHTGK